MLNLTFMIEYIAIQSSKKDLQPQN